MKACASVGMLKLFQKIEKHYIEKHYMKQLKLSKQKHLQNFMTNYTRKYCLAVEVPRASLHPKPLERPAPMTPSSRRCGVVVMVLKDLGQLLKRMANGDVYYVYYLSLPPATKYQHIPA